MQTRRRACVYMVLVHELWGGHVPIECSLCALMQNIKICYNHRCALILITVVAQQPLLHWPARVCAGLNVLLAEGLHMSTCTVTAI